VIFSILVLLAIPSICGNLVMRIRLTKAEPPKNKLVRWRRGSDEVIAMYEELFPGSYMPLLGQFAFWLLPAFAAVGKTTSNLGIENV